MTFFAEILQYQSPLEKRSVHNPKTTPPEIRISL